MPKLYEITDAYSPEETIDSLPVEQTLPTDRPRVIINTAEFDKPKEPTLWDNVGMAGVENKDTALSNLKSKASSIADAIKYASELDQKFTSSVLNFPKKAYENSDDLVKGLKNLFGVGEDERYQLWPEKVVREALTSAGDIAKPNPYTEGSEQYYEYEGKRQEGMVPAAMAISALAGSGGLGGTGAKAGEVALGATPFLRPALKHKEKLYKGKPGQEHQDIIPKELYEDFRQKAMSGEDLAEYNFGFINDKGYFLDREKALKYGIDTGLIDPHSGRFGALTTTLMADSAKEAAAIKQLEILNAKKTNVQMNSDTEVLKNPSQKQMIDLARETKGVRTLLDKDGNMYVWNASNGTHEGISNSLNLKPDWGSANEWFISKNGYFINKQGLGNNPDNWPIWYQEISNRSNSPRPIKIMSDSFKPGMAIEAAAKTAKPTLIPAMKINDKIYKGNVGDEHFDIIKKYLNLNDFEEGLKDKRFGFVNNKGHFLDREKAMEYAKSNELIDNKIKSKLLVSTMLLPDGTLHAAPLKRNTVQSKITGQVLYSDSSKPAAALQANRPTFYSAVEHTVNNIPQTKMTGEQWLGTIANKPGVKGEELDWTGLKGFLEENKNKPVTKAQIEEHLAANKIELKEVNKGAIFDNSIKARKEFENYSEELAAKYDLNPLQNLAMYRKIKNMSDDEVNKYLKLQEEYHKTNVEPATKYHSYQLPGGENYRELLLTLPNEKYNTAKIRAREIEKRINKIQDEFNDLNLLETLEKAPVNIAEQRAKLSNEFDVLTKERREFVMPEAGYKSSHWDEPNILAHVRMNDRNIDGKKSLHLEEIQSDWHQQGRDRGYKQGVQEIKGFKPEELKLEKGEYDWSGISPDGRSAKVGQGVAKTEQEARDYLTRHLNKLAAEQNSAARIAESDKLPDAPFKKTWHELALKRMLREAAEKGYDRLSWTPGEAQAARYDLSKQLKELQYLKNEDGTYSIAGVTKDGGGFNHPDNVSANKLPEIVGKEMAEKIIKNEGKRARGHPSNGGYFEGVDLKVGGEGMKGFYDQIIPKALEKLGKEYGVKVKQSKINNLNEDALYKKYEAEGYDAGEVERLVAKDMLKKGGGNQTVFYIDIPQSLKDTAMRKGFPLFSSTPGYMFVPFDGDPFKDNNK